MASKSIAVAVYLDAAELQYFMMLIQSAKNYQGTREKLAKAYEYFERSQLAHSRCVNCGYPDGKGN